MGPQDSHQQVQLLFTGVTTTTFSGTCDGSLCTFSGNSSGLTTFTVTFSGTTVAPSGNGSCSFSSNVIGSLNNDIVDPENTASTTVTTTATTVSGEVRAISSGIGTRTQSALSGLQGRGARLTSNGGMLEQTLGLSAGDSVIPFGAWSSFSYSEFENEF